MGINKLGERYTRALRSDITYLTSRARESHLKLTRISDVIHQVPMQLVDMKYVMQE